MEKIEIRNMLFLEKDREKEVKINNENFKIKALFEKDYLEISRRVAISRNGLPENNFSQADRYRFSRIATIDVALIDHPDWWTSAENCPESETLEKLMIEIENHSLEFQQKLKKNKFAKRGEAK